MTLFPPAQGTGVGGSTLATFASQKVTKTGTFTISTVTTPLSDIFGCHVTLLSGHLYFAYLKFTVTANSLGGQEPVLDLVPNQGAAFGVAESSVSESTIGTGTFLMSLVSSGPAAFYLTGVGSVDPVGIPRSITTSDFYLSYFQSPGSGSMTITSVTLEVVDLGAYLS